MSRRPKISDVAEAAGVSPALTSRALNQRDGVAPATRARIIAAAEELGYRADPHARALRTGAADSVALLVRNLVNPYFLDVISAAQEAESGQGRSVLVIDSDYSIDREREHIRRLAAQRVGGLAIAPVGPGDVIGLWQDLSPGRPTIVLNATAPGFDDVTRVTPDNRAAVRSAIEHLAEFGHRRITFLTAPADLMADHDRLEAFLQVCDDLDVDPNPLETPLNQRAVHRAVSRAVADGSAGSAVVANSDFTAQAIYVAAREAGLVVGRDLSVVGHDDLPTSALLDPPLTTLRLDRRSIGRAVARRLESSEPLGDHREPVTLVERGSTGPPA